MSLFAIGSVAGIVLGVLATRVLSYIVYQAAPNDPVVLTGVILYHDGPRPRLRLDPRPRALSVNPTILMREQ